jgi:hypothetical protein
MEVLRVQGISRPSKLLSPLCETLAWNDEDGSEADHLSVNHVLMEAQVGIARPGLGA